MKKVKDLLRSGKLTVFEVLQQVSLEELGEAVAFLKKHRPRSEVCRAVHACPLQCNMQAAEQGSGQSVSYA